jgi:hypothetical protein
MSSWRFLLLIPAGCFTAALAWLLWPQISTIAQAATVSDTWQKRNVGVAPLGGQPAGEVASLPEAEKILHGALDHLQSPQARCLETTIWHRATIGAVSYEAEGRYLSAPRGRVRIDLETHTGAAVGKLRIISDGTRILRAVGTKDAAWREAAFVDTWTIVERSKGTLTTEQVRAMFLQGRPGRGPGGLLENTLAQYTWTKKEKVKRAEHIYYKLTGQSKAADQAVTANVSISECRIYLDAETLWPHRFEWWGTESASSPLALFFQLEYRDPVISESLASEKLASEFTIDTRLYPVEDQTESLAKQIFPKQ